MQTPCLILGAGAAGLMCAAHAPAGTIIIDHARKPGEKIRISGGGRCNFTNLGAGPENFLSQNPHFAKSALARYTQWDFIDLVQRHGIAYHEKTLGQLFCDGKATQIIDMLRKEAAHADLWLNTKVLNVEGPAPFKVTLDRDGQHITVEADTLVLATGGKSIPKMGATDLSLRLAQQFGLKLTDTRPALVPLTFADRFAPISGTALPIAAEAGGARFEEAMLFTHRGLSGPAILQISSFWTEGRDITLDLDPRGLIAPALKAQRQTAGRIAVTKALSQHIPAKALAEVVPEMNGNVADLSDTAIEALSHALRHWTLRPTGSEGYRTAEVMLGGVDTNGLNARTMEAKTTPGLYVIGEAVDVTGWLGGYNFQWAWSSGWAAGTAISQQ